MSETCKDCKYGMQIKDAWGLVQCWRYPENVSKVDTHFCGEWKPKQKPQDELLTVISTNEIGKNDE